MADKDMKAYADRFEWNTELESEAQTLMASHIKSIQGNSLTHTTVESHVNGMTGSQINDVLVQLDHEMARLESARELTISLKTKIRDTVIPRG